MCCLPSSGLAGPCRVTDSVLEQTFSSCFPDAAHGALALLNTNLAAIDPSLASLGPQGWLIANTAAHVKAHKNPTAWRFITNAAGSCLSPLNSAVGE